MRCVFQMIGARPRRELGRLRGIFVVHDRIESVRRLDILPDKRIDVGRVAHAVFPAAFRVICAPVMAWRSARKWVTKSAAISCATDFATSAALVVCVAVLSPG